VLFLMSWLILLQNSNHAIRIPQRMPNVSYSVLEVMMFVKGDGSYVNIMEAAADGYTGDDIIGRDDHMLQDVGRRGCILHIRVSIHVFTLMQ
jgi:hypothetical protein